MISWKYKTESVSLVRLPSWLNEQGIEGWDLATVFPITVEMVTAVMRAPVEVTEKPVELPPVESSEVVICACGCGVPVNATQDEIMWQRDNHPVSVWFRGGHGPRGNIFEDDSYYMEEK